MTMDDVDATTLRIVVDGPSGAGKTTTARALGERLGQAVVTPEEVDGRTHLFDWLEYVGGRHDGKPIRTQLVTVPGHRWDHRASLLETADVVVFVVDSTRAGLPASVAAHRELRDLFDGRADAPTVLIQANKRDAHDAVALDEVREALGLDEGDPLVETVASGGDGGRQAFVFAVRLGLPALRSDPKRVEADPGTPADLERHLAQVADRSLVAAAPGGALPVARTEPEAAAVAGGDEDVAPVPAVDLSTLPPPPAPAPGAATEPRRSWWRRMWDA